jgi:predicted MFS family arabinose efflux permease
MKYMIALAAVFLMLLWASPVSHAQGCSLCRDATAGSTPRVRQGLRRGVIALGIPAGAIFVGVLVLARRIKPREE